MAQQRGQPRSGATDWFGGFLGRMIAVMAPLLLALGCSSSSRVEPNTAGQPAPASTLGPTPTTGNVKTTRSAEPPPHEDTSAAIDSQEALSPPVDDTNYVFPLVPSQAASFGPGHHTYPATDIFAAEGTLFVAPIAGIIDFVRHEDTWDPETDVAAERGGLAVAIVGDDGLRYYGSHFSWISPDIEVGERVQAGSPLGLVGRTGNARSKDPHVHFGISAPTTPDDWETRRGTIDPFEVLTAWRDGKVLHRLSR